MYHSDTHIISVCMQKICSMRGECNCIEINDHDVRINMIRLNTNFSKNIYINILSIFNISVLKK